MLGIVNSFSFGPNHVVVFGRSTRSAKFSSRDICDCLEMECGVLVGSLFRFSVGSSVVFCGVFGLSILLA